MIRERLLHSLNQIVQKKVTLISAPAGFGKSTIVSEWIHQSHLRVAWLSVDASDNDLKRFARYLLATIHLQESGIAKDLEESLVGDKDISTESFATLLVNELARLEKELIVVFDDFHVITNSSILELVSFLIEYAPPHFHVVLLSRHDPDLPLHRYRVRGELLEIRLQDMRFTPEEIALLFNSTLRLRLNSEQIATLAAKTEGWIAGLQMAAISLRNTVRDSLPDPTATEEFVRQFAGTNSFVIEYLMEEVLARLPEEMRNSLMILSFFDEFCGELLDAISGRTDGALTLQQIVRDNLFVIALDQHHTWFRFHHLFRDLLSHHASRLQYDASLLYSKAAEWFFRQQRPEEALGAIIASRHAATAVSVCTRYWRETASVYKPDIIQDALQCIPEELLNASPELLFLKALVTLEYRAQNRGVLSGEYCERAFQLLEEEQRNDTEDVLFLRAALGLTRLVSYYHTGKFIQVEECFYQLQPILRSLPPHPRTWWFVAEGTALQIMAHTLFVFQRLEDGVAMYERIVALFEAENLHSIRIAEAKINLTRGYLAVGAVSKARVVLEEVLSNYCTAENTSSYDNRSHALVIAARLHLDRCEAEEALRILQEALRCFDASLVKDPAVLTSLLDDAYYTAMLIGDSDTARRYLLRIEELIASDTMPVYVPRTSLYIRAAAALRTGDRATIEEWIASYMQQRIGQTTLNPSFKLFSDFHLAEALFQLARYDEASVLAKNTLENALEMRYIRLVIPLYVLCAALAEQQGDEQEAETMMQSYLELAQNTQNYGALVYRKQYLSQHLRERTVRPSFAPSVSAEFRQRLAELLQLPVTATPLRQTSALELTEREFDTLRLLAQGYSNQKIADKLYLSLATVKTHLHNLFHKLEVSNRTEAVLRARTLGLVE